MNHKRILIVEDNEDHRIILRYQLQKMGPFAILEATNGQDALAIVAREPLDLIIMNLGLPVLDGWETTRRIRSLPSPARDIPILAFTAYALPQDEQRARAAGCDAVVTKPVLDIQLLQQIVTRLLTHGRTP
jgi:two-component system cell cycle response regulator DivK